MLGQHASPPIGRFAIGTWVAGTAVVAHAIHLSVPQWHGLAVALGVLAIALWL